jgi:hypothetical protein
MSLQAELAELTEQEIQDRLNLYYDRYLQEINAQLPPGIAPNIIHRDIQLIFVNGRYHGLIPGTTPENYYGGHPGLFYQLLLNALCLKIPNVLIIMSALQDEGPEGKFPIDHTKKETFIRVLIEIMKNNLVGNIIIDYPELEAHREYLKEQVSRIDVTIAPMGAGHPLLHPIYYTKIAELGITSEQTMMVTGLEEKTEQQKVKESHEIQQESKRRQITIWYNKYADRFPGAKFLLLGRSGGISGTTIRAAIGEQDYDRIAKWLIDAKMTDEESLILFGKIIHAINHSEDTDSQEETTRVAAHIGLIEYEALQESIASQTHQDAGKKKKTKKVTKKYKKNIKKTRKHKRKNTKRNKK